MAKEACASIHHKISLPSQRDEFTAVHKKSPEDNVPALPYQPEPTASCHVVLRRPHLSSWHYPQVLAPQVYWLDQLAVVRRIITEEERVEIEAAAAMAASLITSSALVAPARAQGLPSLGRRASSFAVVCGTGKKIKTDKPFGIGGGLTVDHDASGRKVKVSLFVLSFLLAFFLSF